MHKGNIFRSGDNKRIRLPIHQRRGDHADSQ